MKPEYNKEGITGLPDLSKHLRGRPKIEEEEKTEFLVPSRKDGKQEILVLVSKHKIRYVVVSKVGISLSLDTAP